MNLKKLLRTTGVTMTAGSLMLTTAPTASADDLRVDCTPNQVLRAKENKRALSAELDYTGQKEGMIRARSTGIGAWEMFKICNYYGGEYKDQYQYTVLYSQAAQRYVSAEVEYSGADYGMLRARSTSVGQWEKFLEKCDSLHCAYKSVANGKWVAAEFDYKNDGAGMLRARSATIGNWEWFSISGLA